MSGRVKANALSLKVTICQKSIEVLNAIGIFLHPAGIDSTIYTYKNGLNVLEIRRIHGLVLFFHSVTSIVKARQVIAALDYLEGRVSGNTLLQIYDAEYESHKRKNSPLLRIGPRFPMTRLEAVKAAAAKSLQARTKGNRRAYLERLAHRVEALPTSFGVKDIEKVLGVSKPRAQVIGNIMVREGFVKCHFERVPPRFRRKVFERI